MLINDANGAPAGIARVELKLTLDGAQVDAGLHEFRLDKDDTDDVERRDVFFAERIDVHGGPTTLPLLARGIILRIRRNEDRSGESTLKLRGPEGCMDPQLWHQRTDAFGKAAKIEGDWANRHLVAASLDSDAEAGRVDEVLAERPQQVRRLLSDAQEALAAELLLGLDGLELLGPIHTWRWEKGAGRLDAAVVAELWEVDGRLRFLELSTRVDKKPVDAQKRLMESVRSRGLEFDANAQTKANTVLELLATTAAERR
jgi:hypothetical protein